MIAELSTKDWSYNKQAAKGGWINSTTASIQWDTLSPKEAKVKSKSF